jgi:hypothetical protein
MRRLILALLALPLAGGDLYLTPGEFVVTRGQRVAVLIHGVGATPGRLRDAALYTPKGVYNVVNLRAESGTMVGEATVAASGTLVLAARTAPEVVSGERRSGYAKALLVSGSADGHYSRRVGSALELIPEADPYRLRIGERLPVRLLLGGKPAAGVEVEVSRGDGPAQAGGRTDAAGRVEIPITAGGQWRLHAVVRERCAEPQAADWERYSASLTFALPASLGVSIQRSTPRGRGADGSTSIATSAPFLKSMSASGAPSR